MGSARWSADWGRGQGLDWEPRVVARAAAPLGGQWERCSPGVLGTCEQFALLRKCLRQRIAGPVRRSAGLPHRLEAITMKRAGAAAFQRRYMIRRRIALVARQTVFGEHAIPRGQRRIAMNFR